MTTERERELERRVKELEREADLGWNLFFFGLPMTLLLGGLDRIGRSRRERRRREEQERFDAWLSGLDGARRAELDRVLDEGLPLPEGADGNYAAGFRAHTDLMRVLVRDDALHHVARADDARELLARGGVDVQTVSVSWLRGFQAANEALAERFAPVEAT